MLVISVKCFFFKEHNTAVLPQPLLQGESPMLNDHICDSSNAMWNDTDLAQQGGVIFNTPCSLHRPPFEVGFLVHSISSVSPGRTDVLPVVRSTQ